MYVYAVNMFAKLLAIVFSNFFSTKREYEGQITV